MKTIYLNSTDLSYIGDLRCIPRFRHPPEYDPESYSKLLQNEIGEIRYGGICLKFVMGNIPNQDCPYCNGNMSLSVKGPTENDLLNLVKICYLTCDKCNSRSPSIHMARKLTEDMGKEELEAWIKQRYSVRMPWDYAIKEKDNARD